MKPANTLDKLVGWVSPTWGLRRARARALTEALGYNAARADRRVAGWISTGTSANAEIGAALPKLRERMRDLVRNDPYAKRGKRLWVANTVGTGIVVNCDNLAVLDLWKRWCEECDADDQLDMAGLDAMVVGAVLESGECLVRFRNRLPQDGMLTVPLQIQVLEGDYLDLSKNGVTNFGYIYQGIEFDKLGTRIAYWIFDRHPGDVGTVPVTKGYDSHRIPASEIIHVYEKERPGQIRGVPRFSSVVLALKDLDDYDDAELVRKKIESCFAAFVTQTEDFSTRTITGENAGTDTQGTLLEELYPGMITHLQPGEQVTFGTPSAVAGYTDFYKCKTHKIAAGMDVPYELMSGDLSQVSYSSYRAGLNEFRREVMMFQWLVLVPIYKQAVWNRWLQTAKTVGLVGAQINLQVKYVMPRFESVDPMKDAKAQQTRIRNGMQTLPDAIAENGYDFEEQLQEIARANAKLDALGIKLDCDPRQDKGKSTEEGGVGNGGKTAD